MAYERVTALPSPIQLRTGTIAVAHVGGRALFAFRATPAEEILVAK
jgi:hypothetical protein